MRTLLLALLSVLTVESAIAFAGPPPTDPQLLEPLERGLGVPRVTVTHTDAPPRGARWHQRRRAR